MIYALVAVGFVIIYKASDVINFAQGEFLLLGAYLAFAFIAQIGLPWSLGVAATLVTALAIGLVVERFVLRPLIGEPIISMIMVTIGLSSVLKAVVHAIWGAAPRSFPGFLPSTPINVLGVVVTEDRLLTIALAGALLGLLTLFFRYTRDGIAMRAIADDQQAALSMGISIKRVLAVAWAMSAVAAAVGGIMVANLVGVSHDISYVGPARLPGGDPGRARLDPRRDRRRRDHRAARGVHRRLRRRRVEPDRPVHRSDRGLDGAALRAVR